MIAYNYAGGIAGGNWGVVEECYALGGISSGYRNAVNQGQLRNCLLYTSNKRLLLAVAKAMLYAQSAADKKPSSGKEPPREKSA